MNTIIIRKPKFMRRDTAAWAYLKTAESIARLMNTPNLTVEEQYELLRKLGECLNKASKAAGFLRTKDFIKWSETHKPH